MRGASQWKYIVTLSDKRYYSFKKDSRRRYCKVRKVKQSTCIHIHQVSCQCSNQLYTQQARTRFVCTSVRKSIRIVRIMTRKDMKNVYVHPNYRVFKQYIRFKLGKKSRLHKRAARCTKLPLCAGSGEGPDHKGLLYAALPCISARGCFHGSNP